MDANPRVVFLDAATFGDASLQIFSSKWDCSVYPFTHPQSAAQRLRGQQVAVVNKVVLDREILSSEMAQALKLVAVAATGTDNVDLETARHRGIGVCNVPGYATESVAQFTMALILEMATHAGSYAGLVRAGAWEKSPIFTLLDYPMVELAGKVLGVIGHGRIGQRVAAIAQAFGADILVCARPGHVGPVPDGRVALDELLTRADFVTLHCPLTPRTKNLIDARALALMKPGAFLINTARGALVDSWALIDALKNGRLAGAALDVLTEEPPPPDHPLVRAGRELGSLLMTPHCAWATREARQRLIAEVAENLAAFLAGKRRNRVD
jgi:glycerate dehydrogenase